jgi:hypothetical protein
VLWADPEQNPELLRAAPTWSEDLRKVQKKACTIVRKIMERMSYHAQIDRKKIQKRQQEARGMI